MEKQLNEIITDPIFIESVKKHIEKIRKVRMNQPAPPPGFRYKRDWYNRMIEHGELNSDFFIQNIVAIWNKKSNLSSEVRNIINSVCGDALVETINSYKNQTLIHT